VAPTLMLIKDLTNDSGGTLQESDFTITVTGDDSDTEAYPGTSDHSSGIGYTGTPDPGIAVTIFGGVQYTVSEDTLPDNYELTGIVCMDVDTQQDVGTTFTPSIGQNIVCTVSNDDVQQNAFFRTTKSFSDDSSAAVQVQLICNTGLPLDQTFTIWQGHPVNFVVHDFEPGTMDCYIQEIGAGTDGYTSSYLAGTEDGQGGVRTEADGCYFDDVEGGQFTCDLSNLLDPVSFTVRKNWLDVEQGVDVQLYAQAGYTCYNVRTAPDGGLQEISGGMDFNGIEDYDVVTDIYPAFDGSSYCVATEDWLPSAAEGDDSDCNKVELTVGESASCTIYNTVFFEGIPTLSQWGLAILAVLTLGVGLVGFRRFV
ncbi:MAG: IPTL-CTERM sorting domain-containing protein, partial [Lysobacterales bacterium]